MKTILYLLLAAATPTVPPSIPAPTPGTVSGPAPSDSPQPAAKTEATPDASPAAAPTPEPLAKPVLFRGACTPGGGPAGCRVFAVGYVTDAGIEPFACEDDKEFRTRIAARYFVPGTELDLHLRGAPTGVFTVLKEDAPSRGCGTRAEGRRRGAPGNTYSFVALHPDDPIKLAAVRYPTGVQPSPQPLAAAAFEGQVGAANISVREHRRLRDGDASVIVIEVWAGDARGILIAEGEGPDASKWKIVWKDIAEAGKPNLEIVDSFDLGADGTPDVLFERVRRGEPSEYVILKREKGSWR